MNRIGRAGLLPLKLICCELIVTVNTCIGKEDREPPWRWLLKVPTPFGTAKIAIGTQKLESKNDSKKQ